MDYKFMWIRRWRSGGRSAGKEFVQLWESVIPRVVHNVRELFTKLSTRFSTVIAESYSTIHRLYYYNYFI